jgi:nitrite reductase/ring-hydroxylating ferredoxin subunit
MTAAAVQHYKPTESQYKGGAEEMYVTYDLCQHTRGEGQALYPKAKRVYIAGQVNAWHVGTFEKRTGKKVYGVKIDYEQSRHGYTRQEYFARRGNTRYRVAPTQVKGSKARFSKIVEVPEAAQNVQFHTRQLPQQYRQALQDVR